MASAIDLWHQCIENAALDPEMMTEEVVVFEVTINDLYVNGVDFLIWNDQQKLTEIRVFIRPFEALNAIKEFMVKYL